ncbi:PIG-L family deacetylase [Dictyobacter arantiisoli]|uniref:GlcNAc-PI de-N-acetylase n=1 Tax=Dictyobacter arantiisoli TaxID=2014874 RepID=A0A5A5TBJ8_9CHLR|nr:PIG-L family deacetylase [Dictyobacter arantiisoli]GCF08379.1 GlcNAc-PI de-N-acetylase [Dictyobacter arantiisoli]
MVKSILACFAHPDDEAGLGALIAKYRAEGAQATLICTTNGDVGTVDAHHLQGYASIAELRRAELQRAADAIGFTEVVTFGYRDSGMMGTEDNQHPESMWQAPLEEVTQRVVEVMRRVRPQIVFTFNTYGAYGHPDHIKINQATHAALEILLAEPEHPQKLYYTSIPRNMLRIQLTLMRLLGKDPRKSGRNADVDMVAAYEAQDAITTRIGVRKYQEVSWQALQSYASQISIPPLFRVLRKVIGPLLFGTTTLSRAWPEHKAGELIEHDLFSGVTVNP